MTEVSGPGLETVTRALGVRARRTAAAISAEHLGWIVAVVAIGVLIVAPIASLGGALVGHGLAAVGAAADATAPTAIINTLWTSAIMTILAVAGGLAAALVTERTAAPGRRWLRLALLLPLLMPALVSSVGWVDAYAPAGLVDQLTGFGVPALYGPLGVVVVMSAGAVPLAYLVIAGGLASRAEPDLERAARASGADGWDAFRTITFPLLRPSLAAAAVLVFVLGVNSFDVPAVLGLPSGFTTMTTRVYSDLVLSADPGAFERVLLLACLLVLVAASIAAVADSVGPGARAVRTGGPTGAPTNRGGPGAVAAAGILWLWVTLTAVLPLVALVLTALTRAIGLPPIPSNWTLDNFASALTGSAGPALLHSVALGFTAASLALLLGGLVVLLRGHRAGRFLGSAVTLGFAVPGSALAVGVLLAYGGWMRGGVALILIAYLAKFWALGYRPLAAAGDGMPSDLIHAARASGASPRMTMRTIVVPMLLPALAAAWLLVFLFALHELTMSSLLYGPGSETLAVLVLNLQELGDPTVTAALAVLLTILVLVAVAPIVLFRRARRWLGIPM